MFDIHLMGLHQQYHAVVLDREVARTTHKQFETAHNQSYSHGLDSETRAMDAEAQNEVLQAQIAQKEAMLGAEQVKNAIVVVKCQKVETRVRRIEEEKAILATELQDERQKCSELEKIGRQKDEELKGLETATRQLQSSNQELSTLFDEEKCSHSALRVRNSSLNASHATLEATHNALLSAQSHLSNEHSTNLSRLTHFQSKYAEMDQLHSNAVQKVEKLQDILNDAEHDRDQYKAKVREMEAAQRGWETARSQLQQQIEDSRQMTSTSATGTSNPHPIVNHPGLSQASPGPAPPGFVPLAQYDQLRLDSHVNHATLARRYDHLAQRFEAERKQRKEEEDAARLSNAEVCNLEAKVAKLKRALMEQEVKTAVAQSGAERSREQLALEQTDCKAWKESYRISSTQLEKLKANTKPPISQQEANPGMQQVLELTKKLAGFEAKIERLESTLRDSEMAKEKIEGEKELLRTQLNESLEGSKTKKRPGAAARATASTSTTAATTVDVPAPATAAVPPIHPKQKKRSRAEETTNPKEPMNEVNNEDDPLPSAPVKKKRRIIRAVADSADDWEAAVEDGGRDRPGASAADAGPSSSRRRSYGIPLALGVAQLTAAAAAPGPVLEPTAPS